MIPILYETGSSTARMSKYQLPTRDEQGERRSLRSLKWQILQRNRVPTSTINSTRQLQHHTITLQ
ncbi:unnamed protein product [Hymenolepis diminuta]|uniref:Uncharacterized protein n=1 Tax=Hymenolepis diminuta TaxID=6216 RepID=A0A564Z301_HYMDI|nr:unnamed protein product [Hymenolepis diminuta]